jgi:hypothetical protein
MDISSQRMTNGAVAPGPKSLSAWLGPAHYALWKRLREFIDNTYPDVFTPDWIFGGQKYGWGLRFKKSKSFCTLIPERNRLLIQIVFGGKERDTVESVINNLSPRVRTRYREATTYHDGKWVAFPIDGNEDLVEILELLAVKRAPTAQRVTLHSA